MLLIFLIISTLPTLYTINKLCKLKDLNLIDIFQVFSCLYYALIPMKIIYLDIPELKYEYSNDILSPLYFFIFNTFLLITNKIWTKNNDYKISPINTTRYLAFLNDKLIIKKNYSIFFLIYFILLIIPLTNYSNLTDDNYEQNITAAYGLGVGFVERIKLIFIYNTYPIIILLNIKYIIDYKNKGKITNFIAIISLIIGCICVVLATKTMMIFTTIFITLFFYSIKKTLINIKFVIKMIFIFSIVFLILFPMSQKIRILKQKKIINNEKIDFIEVISDFINLDSSENNEISRKYDNYKARSNNVYQTLHWAITNDYMGGGKLTMMIYKYLIPQKINDSSEGNILGDLYLEKNADIGESVLAWYIADWGIIGIIFSILHLIIITFFWIIYRLIFYFIIPDNKINLLLVYCLLLEFINIEKNPCTHFHSYYSKWLIVYISYISIFYILDLVDKKYKKYKLNKMKNNTFIIFIKRDNIQY